MAGQKLGVEPVIDPTALVRESTLGRYTEVGARTKIVETTMGDYSYIVTDGDVIYTTIGRFCSIAAQVRINPGNHPMWRASQAHFSYRASAYFEGEDDEAEFFDWRRAHHVTIGNDVWIGHGAPCPTNVNQIKIDAKSSRNELGHSEQNCDSVGETVSLYEYERLAIRLARRPAEREKLI